MDPTPGEYRFFIYFLQQQEEEQRPGKKRGEAGRPGSLPSSSPKPCLKRKAAREACARGGVWCKEHRPSYDPAPKGAPEDWRCLLRALPHPPGKGARARAAVDQDQGGKWKPTYGLQITTGCILEGGAAEGLGKCGQRGPGEEDAREKCGSSLLRNSSRSNKAGRLRKKYQFQGSYG